MPPSPGRRALLRAAGSSVLVGLAGCSGLVGSRADTDGPPPGSPTEPASANGLTAADIELGVELERQFTPAHPAHLVIELRNAGDDWLEFTYGPVLFSELRSEPAGLALMPDDRSRFSAMTPDETGETVSFVPETPDDGCWREPAGSWIVDAIGRTASLGPGDVVTEGYTVLTTGDGECLPPDTYRFDQRLDVETRITTRSNRETGGTAASVTLAFALEIDEAGTVSAAALTPQLND